MHLICSEEEEEEVSSDVAYDTDGEELPRLVRGKRRGAVAPDIYRHVYRQPVKARLCQGLWVAESPWVEPPGVSSSTGRR